MTDREAVKQALETLELVRSSHNVMLLSDPPQDAWKTRGVDFKILQVITALRERLEQPEQDPVAWMAHKSKMLPTFHRTFVAAQGWADNPTPLYTAPPQRKPLTNEEIVDIWVATDVPILSATYFKLVRQIEAAHGIGEKP